jgi:hypothetical protein
MPGSGDRIRVKIFDKVGAPPPRPPISPACPLLIVFWCASLPQESGATVYDNQVGLEGPLDNGLQTFHIQGGNITPVRCGSGRTPVFCWPGVRRFASSLKASGAGPASAVGWLVGSRGARPKGRQRPSVHADGAVLAAVVRAGSTGAFANSGGQITPTPAATTTATAATTDAHHQNALARAEPSRHASTSKAGRRARRQPRTAPLVLRCPRRRVSNGRTTPLPRAAPHSDLDPRSLLRAERIIEERRTTTLAKTRVTRNAPQAPQSTARSTAECPSALHRPPNAKGVPRLTEPSLVKDTSRASNRLHLQALAPASCFSATRTAQASATHAPAA